jgi:hypothetical protein
VTGWSRSPGGGPLRTTACSSASSCTCAAPSAAQAPRQAGGCAGTASSRVNGRGSTWARAAVAAPASVPRALSAAVIRASARCRSHATTRAAIVCTAVIAAPAWCQACPSPDVPARCPACIAWSRIPVGVSPFAYDSARCSPPCVASVNVTVATAAYRRRASGHTAANWTTTDTATSRHGTAASAIAWCPNAASTVPSTANRPARAHVPARLARPAPVRSSCPVTSSCGTVVHRPPATGDRRPPRPAPR